LKKKKLPKKRLVMEVSDLTVKDFSLHSEGLSQSLINAFMSCPRKFLFKINRIRKKTGKTTMVFGNICHDVLDEIYTKEKISEKFIDNCIDDCTEEMEDVLDRDLEIIGAKAFAVLSEYVKFYKDDFKNNKYGKPEEVFDIESGVDGIFAKRRGKIDGQFSPRNSDENWLIERKTKGQIQIDSLLTYLSMDFQSLYYTLAKEVRDDMVISGVLYDVIRNPGTKPKQGEELPDFIERLRLTIQKNPEHFFMRFEVPFNKNDKLEFKNELVRKVKDIFFKLQACAKGAPCEVFYRNQESCMGKFTCDYLEACTTKSLRNYYENKHLFSELKG